jgi:hypothetical protein
LSGAKIIERHDSSNISHTIDEHEVSDNADSVEWYNPKQREIVSYILSCPDFKHTTKSVIEHFNPDREIALSRNEDDANRKVWYSVLQKLRTARKNIKKSHSGDWIDDRIGQEKEYVFESVNR